MDYSTCIECGNMDLGSSESLRSNVGRNGWLLWYPSMVDVSIRPSWFYHESENKSIKLTQDLIDLYMNSVGGNCMLLLNVPPAKNGKLHPVDIARLHEFGDYLRRIFSINLGENARIN